MASLLIRKGRVIDPASKLDAVRDILVEGGKISKVAKRINVRGVNLVDAEGFLVLPGLIDMHAHLRDPGRPDKETIASGTRAAARGGFTSVCCMANTNPTVDNPAVVKYIINKAETDGVVNVFPIGAVTRGLKGEILAELGLMLEEGAVAFSDDGSPITSAAIMRRALEYSRQFGATIISHCEDLSLSHNGVMNESALSTEIGLPGIPSLAEEIMVARDVRLAEEYGKVHIAHVSSARSVEIIRKAKRRGVKVSCETCPQYFSLSEEAVKEYDTNAKVNPPLKSLRDIKAIIAGLADGTIDAIATDHAPHNIEEKNVEFNLASFGMIGLETALSLTITTLVDNKKLNLKTAIEKLTLGPARILNLPKGTLKEGADADIAIVDPKAEWEVDISKLASKSKNSPFAGWRLKGKVLHTIVGGRFVVKNGKLLF